MIAMLFMAVSNPALSRSPRPPKPTPTPIPIPIPTTGFVVGVSPQIVVADFDAERQALVKELGVKSIRVEYNEDIDYDTSIQWAAKNNVSVLMILGYQESLAGDIYNDASTRQAYANRSANLVAKYGNKIKYVEVWNEWNGGAELSCGGWPNCSAKPYTDLLCKTYTAVKKANPNVQVIGFVNSNVDDQFILEGLKLGADKCVDIISVHPYVYTEYSEYSVGANGNATAAVAGIRQGIKDLNDQIFKQIGHTIPLAITEEGREDGSNPQITADYITALYKAAPTMPGLMGIWWFSLIDDSDGDWGLVDSNGNKKPSFAALQQL